MPRVVRPADRMWPVVTATLPWLVAGGALGAGLLTSSVFAWIGTGLLSGLSLSGSI